MLSPARFIFASTITIWNSFFKNERSLVNCVIVSELVLVPDASFETIITSPRVISPGYTLYVVGCLFSLSQTIAYPMHWTRRPLHIRRTLSFWPGNCLAVHVAYPLTSGLICSLYSGLKYNLGWKGLVVPSISRLVSLRYLYQMIPRNSAIGISKGSNLCLSPTIHLLPFFYSS